MTDVHVRDERHLNRMPGWYVYRGDKVIIGPCVSREEAESFIVKIGAKA